MLKNVCGIYYLHCAVNGKFYIGQSKGVRKRCQGHIIELKHNKHDNPYLQNTFNKYGLDSFEYGLVVECPEEELDYWEMYYIKEWNTKHPNGFNLNDGGAGGRNPTEESRKKLSESHMGLPNGMKGKKQSEEARKLMSDAKKGKPGIRKGAKLTLEQRKRQSERQKGRPSKTKGRKIHSEESKEKMSKARIGIPTQNGSKRKNSSSKYHGVSFRTDSKNWKSTVQYAGKKYAAGTYSSEDEAALAYNIMATRIMGKEAILNDVENYSLKMEEKVIKVINELERKLNNKKPAKYEHGVYWNNTINKWVATIRDENKKMVYIGSYNNEDNAAYNYNQKAIELYGDRAKLNILPNGFIYIKEEQKDRSEVMQGVKSKRSGEYVGISRIDGKTTKWEANLTYQNECYYLGTFANPIEAVLAYNEAAEFFYGYKAKLNQISKEQIDSLWSDCNDPTNSEF